MSKQKLQQLEKELQNLEREKLSKGESKLEREKSKGESKLEREKSKGESKLEREKSNKRSDGPTRKKSLPKLGKLTRETSNKKSFERPTSPRDSPRRPRSSPPNPEKAANVEKLIKQFTLKIQTVKETDPILSPLMSPKLSDSDNYSEEEKVFQTVFVKEIQRKRSVINLFDNAPEQEKKEENYSTVIFKEDNNNSNNNSDNYSTVVFKDDGDSDNYSTVVLKGSEDGGDSYGTVVMKPDESEVKHRAPKTLRFLDPAFAKTTIGEKKDEGETEIDEKVAEDILKGQTTIVELIMDLQMNLQDLLEKVCIVTNLDVLFQMTNMLKTVRQDILKMKRYVNVVNYSMNFTAGRDEDRLQQAIDYVEDQICGISTLLDSIQHKLPKVKSHHGVLFLLETFQGVQVSVNTIFKLPLDQQ